MEETMLPEEELQRAIDSPSLEVLGGSRLYGTSMSSSDTDTTGFLVPPLAYNQKRYNKGGGRYYFDSVSRVDQDRDRVIYSGDKFVSLLLAGSTRALEALFGAATKRNVHAIDDLGTMLFNARRIFLSRHLFKSFMGYFGHEVRKIFGETTGKLGKKRKISLQDCGYDPKSAYQGIRVVDEGIEIFSTYDLTFPRPQAVFYLQVRSGTLSCDEIREAIKEREAGLNAAMDSSSLPDRPNYEVINSMLPYLLGYKEVKCP